MRNATKTVAFDSRLIVASPPVAVCGGDCGELGCDNLAHLEQQSGITGVHLAQALASRGIWLRSLDDAPRDRNRKLTSFIGCLRQE
ncbi:MAG TPA: hypothetical protein VIZ63_20400 [Povalibacter sp.]